MVCLLMMAVAGEAGDKSDDDKAAEELNTKNCCFMQSHRLSFSTTQQQPQTPAPNSEPSRVFGYNVRQ